MSTAFPFTFDATFEPNSAPVATQTSVSQLGVESTEVARR